MSAWSLAGRRPIPNWLLVYGSLIVLAEVIFVLGRVELGVLLQGGVLFGLAAHNTFSHTPKDPQLPALMMLPLIRILSVVMPMSSVDPMYWYALTGAPALLGIVLVTRAIRLHMGALGLRRPASVSVEVVMALMGIPIGLILVSTAGSSMQIRGDVTVVGFALVVLPFVVVLEEVVFRGVLQHVAAIRSPNLSILIPNVFYAAMYLGSGNGALALAMGGMGVLFSAMVARTGTLWGVLGAHLLMRIVVQLDTGGF